MKNIQYSYWFIFLLPAIFSLSAESITIYAQIYSISGQVADNKSGKELSYANIRVDRTGFGTAANANGEYKMNLSL